MLRMTSCRDHKDTATGLQKKQKGLKVRIHSMCMSLERLQQNTGGKYLTQPKITKSSEVPARLVAVHLRPPALAQVRVPALARIPYQSCARPPVLAADPQSVWGHRFPPSPERRLCPGARDGAGPLKELAPVHHPLPSWWRSAVATPALASVDRVWGC